MAPNPAQEGLLPRMWSNEHAANYMMLARPLQFQVKKEYANEPEAQQLLKNFQQQLSRQEVDYEMYDRFLSTYKNILDIKKPSLWDNLYFMFSYQFNYMYFRYFMWNFVGRQDDVQGKKNNHGNWLSGIPFIDEWHLGASQENLPDDVLNNKGRNTYFFLPLILGILGLIFQMGKSQRQAWVIFVLFMFTGLALKVYLNESPFQPRERDYSLVGSFLTFSIWVGMGVYALFDSLKEKFANKWSALCVSALCLIFVPARMLTQNWDDHNRTGKYSARTLGKSYLDSTSPNNGAMLFSIGDNDTFGLWYMQEVEGYRTDVRVINTSLLATDWYIDQMKRQAYTSAPIPSQLTHDKYAYGVRDAIYYSNRSNKVWNIKDLLRWIESDDPQTKIHYDVEGERVSYDSYPTNKIRVPVNKENVLKSGIVAPEDADKIVEYIDIELPKTGFGKNRLLMLDILANNDWKRPIYFTGGSMSSDEYIWMKDYLQLDGLTYKLVPIKTPIDPKNPYDMGRIDSEKMYNIVQSWDWGNMGSPDIYHDPETRRNGIVLRGALSRLTETLLKEGKNQKAKNIVEMSLTHMPVDFYGYYFTLEPMVEAYYQLGETAKAQNLFLQVAQKYQQDLNYYALLSPEQFYYLSEEMEYALRRYASLVALIPEADAYFRKKQQEVFTNYLNKFMPEENLLEANPPEPILNDSIVRDTLHSEK